MCLESVSPHVAMDMDCRDGRWHISKLHSDNVVQMAWTENLQEVDQVET